MHNVVSGSVESSHAPSPGVSGPAPSSRSGLFRTVIAPLVLLAVIALVMLIVGYAVYGRSAVSTGGALHFGCVFAAVALGALGTTVVFKSGGFDLSAGPILLLSLTMIAWGIKEDVAVICAFGDNLQGAEVKWRQHQAELDARKRGLGWPSQMAFFHDVARNSRYLERWQYIQKSGALYTPYSPALAALLALGAALALGALNGVMVRRLSIPPLFATLGTSVVALSCAQYMSNSSIIRPERSQIPYWIGLPQPGHVCVALAAAIAVGLLLRFGWLPTTGAVASGEFAPGQNKPGVWSTVAACSLAGLLAGLAGICLFPHLTAGGTAEGIGWELRFVAAACIGGAMLRLEHGLVWRQLLGAALIALIDFGCAQLGIFGPGCDALLVAVFVAFLAVDRRAGGAQVSSVIA